MIEAPPDPQPVAITEDHKTEFQWSRELELLISGALVFALLQLPALLDRIWAANHIHLGGATFYSVFSVYYLAKLASFGMIVAILTHFLVRGFWVAILGLRSVFPGGIDREKMHTGPFMRSFYDGRLMTLEELEKRADRLAATAFSFVFLFLLLLLMMSFWAAMAWGVATIVALISGNPRLLAPVFYTIMGSLFVIQASVGLIDKLSKKRTLPPRVSRWGTRVLKVLHYASFSAIYSPLFLTFSTRISRRVITFVQVAFFYGMIFIFLITTLATEGVIGYDSYIHYPKRATNRIMGAGLYENLRTESSPAVVPTIQSDVVQDGYLRLFIPYDAFEDNERLEVLCPQMKALSKDGLTFGRGPKLSETEVVARLDCLRRVYEVTLDGKPPKDIDYVFYTHPQTGVRGRRAMIPIDGLGRGKHLLVVRHAPLPGGKSDEFADRYEIPFWK